MRSFRFSFRRLLQLVFGLGVVGTIGYAFLPQPIPVDLAVVTRGPLRVTVDEDGQTRIKERYIVSSPLAGRLLRLDLDPGDQVFRGTTLLATIEPADPSILDARELAQADARVKSAEAAVKKSDASVRAAQAALTLAEAELGRARQIAKNRVITQEELEKAETLYRTRVEEYRSAEFAEEIARFEAELARAALLRTRPQSNGAARQQNFEIHSPIGGRVLRVFQESTTVIQPGAQLLELGDPEDLEVVIDVLSRDAVSIHPGANVLLDHWGGDFPLRGRVRLVEPSAFTKISALGVEEQRVNVIVDFDDPPEKRRALGDGFRVEARVVTWASDDVLKVPLSALSRHGDQWAVFIVNEGRAQLRTVEIAHQSGQEAEVLNGLQEGEHVIVHPSDSIEPEVAVARR